MRDIVPSPSPNTLPHPMHPYPWYPWPGPPLPPGYIVVGARVPPHLGLGRTMLVSGMMMVVPPEVPPEVPPGAVISVAVPTAPHYYYHRSRAPLPHPSMGMPTYGQSPLAEPAQAQCPAPQGGT